MAKSARSSVKKTNKSRLRKSVFGPLETARTERLSAKLQELAAQPKPETSDMQIDPKSQQDTSTRNDTTSSNEEQAGRSAEDMDVDEPSTTKTRRSKSAKSKGRDVGRISKMMRWFVFGIAILASVLGSKTWEAKSIA